jgi:cytochrome P450
MIEVESEESNSAAASNSKESISNLKLKKTLTFNEIIATAVLFLSAGYETTANSLCFVAYHLAMHPELQEKVCHEVDQILEKYVFTPYLDK